MSLINILGLIVSLCGIGGYNYIMYRNAVRPGGYVRVNKEDDGGSAIQMRQISLGGGSPSSPITRTRARHMGDAGLHENLIEETEM